MIICSPQIWTNPGPVMDIQQIHCSGVNSRTRRDNIFYLWWVQLIIAGLIAAGIVGYMAYTAGGKVRVTQGTYLDHATSKIRSRRDIYLRTVVTKTKRTKSNNHSGGGFGGFSGGFIEQPARKFLK